MLSASGSSLKAPVVRASSRYRADRPSQHSSAHKCRAATQASHDQRSSSAADMSSPNEVTARRNSGTPAA